MVIYPAIALRKAALDKGEKPVWNATKSVKAQIAVAVKDYQLMWCCKPERKPKYCSWPDSSDVPISALELLGIDPRSTS